ncbi:MAG: hypothetical protein NZM00_14625, partial [Anaerolinea sp.]|nr:hypothetical protein [Anaerolinea sp.]
MKMDAGLDTGPILTQRALALAPDETGASLHDKLAVLGGELLIETLPGYLNGTIQPQPQDDALATLAPRIDKDDGRIDWTEPAAVIERTVRAFTPWPGTFTVWRGKLLKILSGSPASGRAEPGRVIAYGRGFAIGTGDELLVPGRVQLAGRAAVTTEEFVRGYPEIVGALLGDDHA